MTHNYASSFLYKTVSKTVGSEKTGNTAIYTMYCFYKRNKPYAVETTDWSVMKDLKKIDIKTKAYIIFFISFIDKYPL